MRSSCSGLGRSLRSRWGVGVKVGSTLLFYFERPHLFNCLSPWPAKFAAIQILCHTSTVLSAYSPTACRSQLRCDLLYSWIRRTFIPFSAESGTEQYFSSEVHHFECDNRNLRSLIIQAQDVTATACVLSRAGIIRLMAAFNKPLAMSQMAITPSVASHERGWAGRAKDQRWTSHFSTSPTFPNPYEWILGGRDEADTK